MNELPRVLFCCFDVIPGPTARSRRLNEYLKAVGQRFQVVVLSNKTPDHSHIERLHGARHMRVPTGSGDMASQVKAFERAVRRQIESEEYAIVHFFDPFSGAAVADARPEGGYKLIYDACTFFSEELPFKEENSARLTARARRQELLCLMTADVVIVGSQVAKRHVHDLGVPLDNVILVRAPVDRTLYPAQPPPTTGKPLQLLHLGNSASYQDLDLLVQALGLLPASCEVRATVVIDRDGAPAKALLEKAQQLNVAHRLQFQEPVVHDEVHRVVCANDVGLVTLADVPRNRRGPSLARLSEYFAAGRPVIAARLPVVEELLPAAAGRLYAPGDAQSLADAIAAVEGDVEARKTMSAASFLAATECDAVTIRGQLLAQYALWLGLTESAEAVLALPSETTQIQGRAGESTQVARVEESAEAAGASPAALVEIGAEPHALTPVSNPGISTPGRPSERATAPIPPADGALPIAAPSMPFPVPPAVVAPLNAPVPPPRPSASPASTAARTTGINVAVSVVPQLTVPMAPPAMPAPRMSPQPVPQAADDDIAEIGGDEIISVGDGDLENDEVMEVDDVESVGTVPTPIASAMDPWLAMAAHGYCPPEATLFVRHTPPTTMPGKDG